MSIRINDRTNCNPLGKIEFYEFVLILINIKWGERNSTYIRLSFNQEQTLDNSRISALVIFWTGQFFVSWWWWGTGPLHAL